MTTKKLYFVFIGMNRFLVADANVGFNAMLISKYRIQDAPTSAADVYGLSLALKTDLPTVSYTFSQVLEMEQYTSSVVKLLSDLFMYKIDINAEAVFTTPVYFPGQPQVVLSYGKYRLPVNTEVTPTLIEVFSTTNGLGGHQLVPWKS